MTHDDTLPAKSSTAGSVAPGRLGLPWLGESLDYARNQFAFVRSRHARYGPVFRTRIAGRIIYCFSGAEGLAFFYDPRNFTREGANPVQVRSLLYPDAIPFIDGPRHAVRRELLMWTFSPKAFPGYLPLIDRTVSRYLQRWAALGTFAWLPELKALAADILCALAGEPDREPGDRPLVEILTRMTRATISPEINLPFTRFGRGMAARDELRTYLTALIADRRNVEGSVLARARAARTGEGVALSDEELVIELNHFFVGAFQTLVAGLSGLALLLFDYPEVRTRVMREARAQEGMRQDSPTLDLLRDLAYQRQVIKEMRRIRPLVAHTFFGRAKADCEFNGCLVPRDAIAIGSLWATMQDPAVFPNPDAFDPDRFGADRAEDAGDYTFVAHGAGSWSGHRCAGEGLAELMLQVFTTRLVGDYHWELAPETRGLDMRLATPWPTGRLLVRVSRA